MVTMPETSGNLVDSAGSNKEGPDLFVYYKCEMKRLLSQSDFLPFATQLTGDICSGGEASERVPFEFSSGSLFSNSVGAGISDHQKERLTSLLRQSVSVLTPEADQMLDPVLGMRQLRSQFKRRKMSTPSESETGQNNKSSSSSSFSKLDSPVSSESCHEVDGDLQFLLANDSSLVEETIKKYSDQLFSTLSHMEKQLEEQLDTVVSTCRPMTLTEKKHLQKLIQKLPPKNFNRIVEIIHRNKPEAKSSEEVFVDLEKEDNTTLWRLYYFVEAVEKAKKLSRNSV